MPTDAWGQIFWTPWHNEDVFLWIVCAGLCMTLQYQDEAAEEKDRHAAACVEQGESEPLW